MNCPLCGGEFDSQALACRAACPMAAVQGCSLVCCPHCGYQMVDEYKSGLARLLRRTLEIIRREPPAEENGIP